MSGGGGGSARTPVVQSDTLKSVANVYILHALCEGPIQGFSMPDKPEKCPLRDNEDAKLTCTYSGDCMKLGYCVKPQKCIKFNGTPIQNSDGTYNFGNIRTAWRLGYPDQRYISSFFIASADISGSVGLPVQVRQEPLFVGDVIGKEGGAHTKNITDLDADEISLRFSLYGLYDQKDNGDITGSSVELKVEIRESTPAAIANDDLGWVEVLRPKKTGKASSKYEWAERISLKLAGENGPWQVKVSRITPDSTTQMLVNDTWWEGLAIIKNKKLKYPSVALCAIRADATQFSSIPNMSFSVKGLIIRIPSNYNPLTREYTGNWDGSFKLAWSNNPAWCFYDLLIEKRYGLGDWIKPEYVDKWGLYEIGKYCDEMVPTGRKDAWGADIKEPRYTLNCYIQTQEEAVRVVQLLASAFHAMTYWAAGAVFAAQDRPTDPSYLFTPANVKDGQFVYSATARRARHNAVVTQWNNPENNYRMEPELYELDEEIRDLGFRFPADRVAFGCTSRSQAIRDAKHTLFTENYQTETVSFSVGLEGAQLRPGDVVAIMDPLRLGTSMGGRVKSVEGNIVTLDREIELEDAQYNLIVTDANGEVAESAVLSYPGTTDRLELLTPIETTKNSVWILATENKAPDLWRVISVTNDDDEGGYAVLALSYDPQKYDWVEKDIVLQDRRGWIGDMLPKALRPPQGLVLSEYLYKDKDDLKVGVQAQWTTGKFNEEENRWEPDAGTQFLPSYQVDEQNWADLPTTNQTVIDIKPVEAPCVLKFSVRSQNPEGETTLPVEATLEILGKTRPPKDVSGFKVSCYDITVLCFKWDANDELDFSHYEIREGTNWDDSSLVVTDLTANSYSQSIGNTRSTSFWIKTRDTSGNWSINATKATLQLFSPVDENVLTVPRKIELAQKWAMILSEQTRLISLVSQYGINSQFLTDYNAAILEFQRFFLTRYSPYEWDNLNGPTDLGVGGNDELAGILKAINDKYVQVIAAVASGQFNHEIATDISRILLEAGYLGDDGKIKWDAINFAAQKVFTHQLYVANFDNLIPNPNSELAPPADGWPDGSFEGLGVIEGNAYDGEHCRYVEAGQTLIVTQDIPCGRGDQYVFSAMVKGAGAKIGIYFNNGNAPAASATCNSAEYTPLDCSIAAPGAPAETTRVTFALIAGPTTDAHFDNLYARRMADGKLLVDGAITANKLEADMAIINSIIRSSNYVNSTANASDAISPLGWKLSGTAFGLDYIDGRNGTLVRRNDNNAEKVIAEFGDNIAVAGRLLSHLASYSDVIGIIASMLPRAAMQLSGIWQGQASSSSLSFSTKINTLPPAGFSTGSTPYCMAFRMPLWFTSDAAGIAESSRWGRYSLLAYVVRVIRPSGGSYSQSLELPVPMTRLIGCWGLDTALASSTPHLAENDSGIFFQWGNSTAYNKTVLILGIGDAQGGTGGGTSEGGTFRPPGRPDMVIPVPH